MVRGSSARLQRWGGAVAALLLLVPLASTSMPRPNLDYHLTAAAGPEPGPLLLVHGYSDTCVDAFNSVDTNHPQSSATTPMAFLEHHGWPAGDLIPIGFYNGEDSCVSSLVGAPNSAGMCDPLAAHRADGSSLDGTLDDPIEHIACALAWYIWTDYSKDGTSVSIIAHSMGGLIVRAAIGLSGQAGNASYNSAFPPSPLLVSSVVTIGTPHGGLSGAYLGYARLFAGSREVDDMASDSTFMTQVLAGVQAPRGAAGTRWSLVSGSIHCNVVLPMALPPTDGRLLSCSSEEAGVRPYPTGDGIVQSSSALGMTADYKVLYGVLDVCCGVTDTGYHDTGEDDSQYQTQYRHAVNTPPNSPLLSLDPPFYQTDGADYSQTVTARTCHSACDGGLDDVHQTQPEQVYHSLALVDLLVLVSNVAQGGAFFDEWQQLGGAKGDLGLPLRRWITRGAGEEQDFQGGSIYWSPTTGTYGVLGKIHDEYESVMHGPDGLLSFPNSDQRSVLAHDGTTVLGAASTFQGTTCGALSGSAIFVHYSLFTEAHEVHGCILQEYGGPTGISGTMGGPAGPLGFPSSDEQPVLASDGTTQIGRQNMFAGTGCGTATGSAILYSGGTGAHEVQGCIYQEFLHAGGPALLGLPTGDEGGVAGGRVSFFNGTGCGAAHGSAVYWSPASSAHTVYGCINQKYAQLGGPVSALGFPISDEYGIAGGRESDFQSGSITYSTSTGAVVHLNSSTTYPAGTHGPGAGCCFSTGGVWFGGGGVGLIGKEIWTYANGTTQSSTATWQFSGLTIGQLYRVEAYIPNNHSNAPHAHYHVVGSTTLDAHVDQENFFNAWALVILAYPSGSGSITVTLDDAGGDSYPLQVGADAMRTVPSNIS